VFVLGVWDWMITLIVMLIPSHRCPKCFVVFIFYVHAVVKWYCWGLITRDLEDT
jgi:hypothetical protein